MSSIDSRARLFPMSAFAALLIAVLACVASATTGAQGAAVSQKESIEQYIQKAQEAIRAKRFGDAKKELKRAQKLQSDSGEVNLLFAVV